MKFKLLNWHKILMAACFLLRILYICLTLLLFGLILFKFQDKTIINYISYSGAFFNAIFNFIVFFLMAYIFRPFNNKIVKVDETVIPKQIRLLLFIFSILNIITIFVSSIIIYLKQIPGFSAVSSYIGKKTGTDGIMNNISTATTSATGHKQIVDDSTSSSNTKTNGKSSTTANNSSSAATSSDMGM